MFKVDVDRGIIIERIASQSEYTMLKSNRYICAATSSGAVDFLDPVSLTVIKTWQAHTAKVSCLDVRNDFLLTCGWSTRPYGHSPSLDTLVKVFDLKRLEQLAPISFQLGAAFVHIHPKTSTTSLIASQNGQIDVIDIMHSEDVKMMHVTLNSSMVHMSISSSGKVWAIADQDNILALWGAPPKLQFNDIVNPTEFADDVAPVARMAVDADL